MSTDMFTNYINHGISMWWIRTPGGAIEHQHAPRGMVPVVEPHIADLTANLRNATA